jgi:hypothetical protein
MNASAILLRHLIHRIFIDGRIQDGVVLSAPHVHNGDDLGAVGLRGGSELSTSQTGSSHLPAEAEFLFILCTCILAEVVSPEADLRTHPSMKSHSRLCITRQMAECYWSEESSLPIVGHHL